jgi:hypothetical protein
MDATMFNKAYMTVEEYFKTDSKEAKDDYYKDKINSSRPLKDEPTIDLAGEKLDDNSQPEQDLFKIYNKDNIDSASPNEQNNNNNGQLNNINANMVTHLNAVNPTNALNMGSSGHGFKERKKPTTLLKDNYEHLQLDRDNNFNQKDNKNCYVNNFKNNTDVKSLYKNNFSQGDYKGDDANINNNVKSLTKNNLDQDDHKDSHAIKIKNDNTDVKSLTNNNLDQNNCKDTYVNYFKNNTDVYLYKNNFNDTQPAMRELNNNNRPTVDETLNDPKSPDLITQSNDVKPELANQKSTLPSNKAKPKNDNYCENNFDVASQDCYTNNFDINPNPIKLESMNSSIVNDKGKNIMTIGIENQQGVAGKSDEKILSPISVKSNSYHSELVSNTNEIKEATYGYYGGGGGRAGEALNEEEYQNTDKNYSSNNLGNNGNFTSINNNNLSIKDLHNGKVLMINSSNNLNFQVESCNNTNQYDYTKITSNQQIQINTENTAIKINSNNNFVYYQNKFISVQNPSAEENYHNEYNKSKFEYLKMNSKISKISSHHPFNDGIEERISNNDYLANKGQLYNSMNEIEFSKGHDMVEPSRLEMDNKSVKKVSNLDFGGLMSNNDATYEYNRQPSKNLTKVKSLRPAITEENIYNTEERFLDNKTTNANKPGIVLVDNYPRQNFNNNRLKLADINNNSFPPGAEGDNNYANQHLPKGPVNNNVIINNNNFLNNTTNSVNHVEVADIKISDESKNAITVTDYDKLSPEEAIKYDRRTFKKYFTDETIKHHTIIGLVIKDSIKDPIYIRLFKFFVLCHMIYGFNAITYTDDYIDLLAENRTVKNY